MTEERDRPEQDDRELEERRDEVQSEEGHSGSVPRGNPPIDDDEVENADDDLDSVSGN